MKKPTNMKDFEILNKLPKRHYLDQDLYKFTMMYFIMVNFPESIVRYEFVDRRNNQYPHGLGAILRKRINSFSNMKLSKEDRNAFQSKCTFLPNVFYDFLEGFQLDPSDVSIFQKADGQLKISVEGYWYRTVLWEIIIMSEISEINYLMTGEKSPENPDVISEFNQKKAVKLRFSGANFADFGTRRRYSFDNQKNVIKDLMNGGNKAFIGTSNVFFAIRNDIKMIGTYAHETVSGVGAIYGYLHANKHMMKMWSDLFKGRLGIALTDTFGLDAFLKDFNTEYARLFDGVRHDSGNPFVFADKIIEHYKKLGIDPLTKTIVFSDGLNTNMAVELTTYCRGKIKLSFGIGTHFTNDLMNVTPLNMVIKLFMIDGENVIKLSDVQGKHTGNKKTIELVKEITNYKPL
jgi:nicotinate phosphoribosyltransferase